MSVPIQPLADYVVAVGEEAQKKTASGILLTDAGAEKPKTAKVVGIGPKVKVIKVGDVIVCKNYSQTELSRENEDYILVKEEDVIATIK